MAGRPWVRWLVPVAAVAVVAGGVTVYAQADSEPRLPERSAAQLLVDLQTARLDGLSGTVVVRSDLGLPRMPEGQGGLLGLINGSTTFRVWYAGPDKVRIALMAATGESDLVTDGREMWTWSSATKEVHHLVLPSSRQGTTDEPGTASSAPVPTPREIAERALAALDPSTEVTTDRSVRVADRDAYELVLRPRDTGSRIGQVRIAVDAEEHVPLRARVFAAGAGGDEAALEAGFTSVSFERPDPDRFRFVPPPGSRVVEEPAGWFEDLAKGIGPTDRDATDEDAADGDPADTAADMILGLLGRTGAGGLVDAIPVRDVDLVGAGWARVLVVRLDRPVALGDRSGTAAPTGTTGDLVEGFFGVLPEIEGPWGRGRMYRAPLLTVLLTDDGRVLVGPVTPERITQVAGDTAAGGAER
ncbi:MAG: hypothetical protein GXX79_07030 [Actinomycetales bacterium]|nr:hypothetical protein [Actinomycetales bacterium]